MITRAGPVDGQHRTWWIRAPARAASLTKATSTLYNRISARIRDGIALAEARNGACAACFMALRPQVMAQVRRADEVVTCDHCNRILYYVQPDKAASTTAASAQPNATAH